MEVKIFNKLVRDEIPNIIKQRNGTPKTRVLSDEAFVLELKKKLQEEVDEFMADESIEELADIMEVIHAFLDVKQKTFTELESLRKEKAKNRGGFAKRIFLESVENPY